MTTITRIGRTHWEERGERIRQARDFIGMSQSHLAELVSAHLDKDISRQVVYNIEAGERDTKKDELRVIAFYLEQSEAWLDVDEGGVFNPLAKNRLFVLPLGLSTHNTLAVAA